MLVHLILTGHIFCYCFCDHLSTGHLKIYWYWLHEILFTPDIYFYFMFHLFFLCIVNLGLACFVHKCRPCKLFCIMELRVVLLSFEVFGKTCYVKMFPGLLVDTMFCACGIILYFGLELFVFKSSTGVSLRAII